MDSRFSYPFSAESRPLLYYEIAFLNHEMCRDGPRAHEKAKGYSECLLNAWIPTDLVLSNSMPQKCNGNRSAKILAYLALRLPSSELRLIACYQDQRGYSGESIAA